MFSVMRCHQPTRVAVEWANVLLVLVQSRGRSLRAIALAAWRWSSSMDTSLSSQENRGQLCAWNKEHFGESCVFSVVIGVFAFAVCESGQGSREVPGPSVPGRVRSVPPRQMAVRNVQVRTRMRCLLPERRVARRPHQSGQWRRVVSLERKHHST